MSEAVGVAMLSKALALSEWSRVLSNRLSIPLFIFADFSPYMMEAKYLIC